MPDILKHLEELSNWTKAWWFLVLLGVPTVLSRNVASIGWWLLFIFALGGLISSILHLRTLKIIGIIGMIILNSEYGILYQVVEQDEETPAWYHHGYEGFDKLEAYTSLKRMRDTYGKYGRVFKLRSRQILPWVFDDA